jgi:hypothetical protein
VICNEDVDIEAAFSGTEILDRLTATGHGRLAVVFVGA